MTVLRRKGVKEAVQRFVERVSQLPQVEAVLLAWGDEGWKCASLFLSLTFRLWMLSEKRKAK